MQWGALFRRRKSDEPGTKVEVLLLAESSALIRYPPESFFTSYAAAMRRRQAPRTPAP